MATTSKYIQLSASVLLEYQYRDQGSTANEFTTSAAPWYLMDNGHDGTTSIFNSDNSINITNNVRTRAGVLIDSVTSQYGYLKLDQILALNDYDPNLTDSANLPVTFSSVHNVSYDVIRLHLVQGFNFENYEGFFFRMGFTNNDEKTIYHTNLAYRKSDSYAQINPEPFIMGGRYYASYIEIKVPALYNLIEEYRNAVYASLPTGDLPSSKLTNGYGPKFNSLIETNFGWISSEKVINNQTYFYTYELTSIDLPVRDVFNDVSAVIQNSSQGDYIEMYAAYNGSVIDNFITQLNNAPGNDYIILHELNVYEYVWTSGASAIWIKTSSLEFVQDNNYEDPILYRPVIQNQAASSYRIDYVIRLFNRADNTSVWKTASAQFNNALKYGKSLQRIYLGDNPIQPKVYNKIYDKNLSMYGNTNTESVLKDQAKYTKYVTSFAETRQVSITSDNAYLYTNPNTGVTTIQTNGNSQTQTIAGQGLGTINLTASDTFLKFVIYQGDPQKIAKFFDLTGVGKLSLNFFTNSGEIKKIESYQSEQISPANGEVLFMIPSKDSLEINDFVNQNFTISAFNGSIESQLYSGKFIPISGITDKMKDEKINSLQEQVKELNTAYQALKSLYDASSEENAVLKTNNKTQNTTIQDLQKELNLKIQENNSLLEDDVMDEAEKQRLLEEIARLEALAATPPPPPPTGPGIGSTVPMTPDQVNEYIQANMPQQVIKPEKSTKLASIKKSPVSPYANDSRVFNTTVDKPSTDNESLDRRQNEL